MSDPLDYFTNHPAAADFGTFMENLATKEALDTSINSHYKLGYLVGAVKGAMFLSNKQDIKDALMRALEHIKEA